MTEEIFKQHIKNLIDFNEQINLLDSLLGPLDPENFICNLIQSYGDLILTDFLEVEDINCLDEEMIQLFWDSIAYKKDPDKIVKKIKNEWLRLVQ